MSKYDYPSRNINVKLNGLKMSFEMELQSNVFDDLRHKLCNRPMHNDIIFRLGRMKITKNVYSNRSAVLS